MVRDFNLLVVRPHRLAGSAFTGSVYLFYLRNSSCLPLFYNMLKFSLLDFNFYCRCSIPMIHEALLMKEFLILREGTYYKFSVGERRGNLHLTKEVCCYRLKRGGGYRPIHKYAKDF